MKQLKDRVLEVSQTQGTGDYALAGAVTGFRAFSPAVNVGDTADYYAEEVDGTGVPSGAWETGMGTYATGNKLQRTTIYASSNGGTPINWGVGTRRVAISLTSQTLADAVNSAEIASGYVAAANAAKVAAQAAAAAAAASAATLDLSAPNPIGNATPNSGAFTTLSATGNTTLGDATTDTLNVGNGGLIKDAAGNVGIGTSTPAYKLDVRGAIAAGNGTIFGGISYSSRAEIGAMSNHNLGLITNNDTKVIIDTAGNVGIGVTPIAGAGFLQFPAGNQIGNHGDNFSITSASKYVAGWLYASTGTPALRYEQLAGKHTWYSAPTGTAGDPISFTQAMTLDTGRNLGLGITPSAWFEGTGLDLGNYAGMQQWASQGGVGIHANSYRSGDNAYTYKYSYFASMYLQGAGNHTWYIAPSGTAGAPISFTQAMKLDAGGGLSLHAKYGVSNGFDFVQDNASSGAAAQYTNHPSGTATGAYYQIFTYNENPIGTITQSGTTAVAYNTTSDHRLKENVRDADAARFMDIQFRDFEWVDGRHDCGVIAHELQQVYPDLVLGEKDATEVRAVEITPAIPAVFDEDGSEVTPAVSAVTEEQPFPVYQQVNYIGLIGRMGTRVQALQRTVDAQAALIAAMEARLSALEA